MLQKNTILVTGGAGFIGSNFIRHILATRKNVRVVCLDALTYAGNRENLKGLSKDRLSFVKGSISDQPLIKRVMEKFSPSHIINFAAESHVDKSIHGGAQSFMDTNVIGTTALLEVVKEFPIKKFVQISTDEVYGSLKLTTKKRFTEQSPLAPNSPYAASKAAADMVARSFYKTYATPVVITRCSNNYGPFQYPEKLIPYSITRLLKGEQIALYGDGLYVRDWIHVNDHCSGLLCVLEKGAIGEVYNIGADEEVSNLTLAQLLTDYFGKKENAVAFIEDRPGHDRRYAIDSTKIQENLGWQPRHVFTKSFQDTVAWYLENQGWIKRALKQKEKANTHIQR